MWRMRMLLPNSTVAPSRSRPAAAGSPRSSAAASRVANTWAHACQSRAPGSVSRNARARRSTSPVPALASSLAMAWLTADWVRCSRRAAPEKLPAWPRAWKARN